MKNKVHNYPNPDLVETGEKIRALRESRDMSQEQLALLLDTTKNSISKYENGQMEMKISMLYKLADLFGVTPNDLTPKHILEKTYDEKRKLIENIIQMLMNITYENLSLFETAITSLLQSILKFQKNNYSNSMFTWTKPRNFHVYDDDKL